MITKNIKKCTLNFYKTTKKTLLDYDPNKDYYKILGINQTASEKEIKNAYYTLAKKYHPDLNQGKTNEQFKEMTAAYDILSNPDKRKQYDSSRSFGSYFTGKQYSSNTNKTYNSGYSNNSYRSNNNRDFRDDPFFKNFENMFRGFRQSYQQKQEEYANNFRDSQNMNFKARHYNRNKSYFSTFKVKEESHDKPHGEKGKGSFAKKYFDKNKKYYETFKTENPENPENPGNTTHNYNNNPRYENGSYTDYKQHGNESQPQSPIMYFILTFFGIFLGSMIIHSIFNSGKGRTEHHSSRQHVSENRSKNTATSWQQQQQNTSADQFQQGFNTQPNYSEKNEQFYSDPYKK
jgi:curved DNA-binding protein CbpA